MGVSQGAEGVERPMGMGPESNGHGTQIQWALVWNPMGMGFGFNGHRIQIQWALDSRPMPIGRTTASAGVRDPSPPRRRRNVRRLVALGAGMWYNMRIMLIVNTRYRLCELFGIPIYVDISFAVLLLMFLLSFGSFGYGLTAVLLLSISVIAHEFAHALTARAFGYQTKDITISLVGGCASLISMPRKASQEFLTAIAGPAASFALALIGYVVCMFMPIQSDWLFFVFAYLGWMNLMLGAFNLLPGFPMDGGRIFRSVLRAFLSRPQATFVAMWVGRVFAIVLGLSGLSAMVNGGSFGFVRLLIAYMIWQEGKREYLMAQMESSWDYGDFRARVSPPPYGGDEEDVDISRN